MKEITKQIVVNLSENRTIIELGELTQKFKSEIYLSMIVQGSIA